MEMRRTGHLARLRRQTNVRLHAVRSGRVTKAPQLPGSAAQQQPSNADTSSAGRPTQPADSFQDPVARKLTALHCRWFMPESVVAEMVGLDSANALRTWQARQDLGVYMYGADVDRYDLDKTCYWLLGGTIKPTASSLGIKFHCHEQRTVVEKLEASTPAVNFIMGLHVGDVDGTLLDQVSKIIDLAYEYPSVFYIEQLVDQLPC